MSPCPPGPLLTKLNPVRGGSSFCPWFFSWTSGFSCCKLSQVGPSCRGRSWATARGVSAGPGVVAPLHVPLSRGSLLCLGLTWPSGAFPGHSPPPRGHCTPLPWIGGERDGSSQCHFCHPLSLSCPFAGQELGLGWGCRAELGSLVFLKWVLLLLGLGGAPAPLCEPPAPAQCRAVLQPPCPCCSCSSVRIWSVHVHVCLTPSSDPGPRGAQGSPRDLSESWGPFLLSPPRWDQGHVLGTPSGGLKRVLSAGTTR